MLPRSLVQLIFLLALACLGSGLYLRQILPDSQQILPELAREPAQRGTSAKPFTAQVQDLRYDVVPRANYDMVGVVVSRHDTSTWWNWIHEAMNDKLNVLDLCVVWGSNVANNNYKKLHYHSGQWTCNVATNSDEVWRQFDQDALSNSHLLTADKRLAKKLRAIKVGDQVRLRGVLADYSLKTGAPFTRPTSLVRTDRGNGACEVMYVEDLQVLRSTSHWPSSLRWFGAILLVISTIAWFGFTSILNE